MNINTTSKPQSYASRDFSKDSSHVKFTLDTKKLEESSIQEIANRFEERSKADSLGLQDLIKQATDIAYVSVQFFGGAVFSQESEDNDPLIEKIHEQIHSAKNTSGIIEMFFTNGDGDAQIQAYYNALESTNQTDMEAKKQRLHDIIDQLLENAYNENPDSSAFQEILWAKGQLEAIPGHLEWLKADLMRSLNDLAHGIKNHNVDEAIRGVINLKEKEGIDMDIPTALTHYYYYYRSCVMSIYHDVASAVLKYLPSQEQEELLSAVAYIIRYDDDQWRDNLRNNPDLTSLTFNIPQISIGSDIDNTDFLLSTLGGMDENSLNQDDTLQKQDTDMKEKILKAAKKILNDDALLQKVMSKA